MAEDSLVNNGHQVRSISIKCWYLALIVQFVPVLEDRRGNVIYFLEKNNLIYVQTKTTNVIDIGRNVLAIAQCTLYFCFRVYFFFILSKHLLFI